MRCKACDKNLNDFESTRKIVREDGTKEYVDLCNKCYTSSEVSSVATVVERYDLAKEDDVDSEFDEDNDNSLLLDEIKGNYDQ